MLARSQRLLSRNGLSDNFDPTITETAVSNVSLLFVSSVAATVIDQASKMLVVRGPAEARFRTIVGSAGLERRLNTRPGLIPLSRRAAAVIWMCAFAGIVMVVIFAQSLPATIAFSLGLVFGGASSNLCDRFLRGHVVDFIAVPRWRTFNLADVAMVVGTAMCAWNLL